MSHRTSVPPPAHPPLPVPSTAYVTHVKPNNTVLTIQTHHVSCNISEYSDKSLLKT